MTQPDAYYYVFNQDRWMLFAILDGTKLTYSVDFPQHPLAKKYASEDVEAPKAYNVSERNEDKLRFVQLSRKRFFKSYTEDFKANA